MRLDGSLEDFGLPDVLQLLAQTHKTGALHLHAPDAERRGVIRVGAGAVDGACSDVRRQVLARRLVGAGLVSDETLAGAAADVRAGSPSLLRALLDRAGLPTDEVNRVAAEQATDAVCELLRWSAGTFSFIIGEPDPNGLTLGLRADELVSEGQRRMQLWPMLTTSIPSPDTVLRLAASVSFDPSCTREEWGLLALVDGNHSVNEIVALLGGSEFAVAGALAALVEKGLLTVDAAGSAQADLHRRQAIIADLEVAGFGVAEPVPDAPFAGAQTAPATTLSDVPQARDAYSNVIAEHHDPAPANSRAAHPLTAQARTFDQPMTNGSAALDTARAVAEPGTGAADPAVRGQDSAVTKSLVLRLIAGVRGL